MTTLLKKILDDFSTHERDADGISKADTVQDLCVSFHAQL